MGTRALPEMYAQQSEGHKAIMPHVTGNMYNLSGKLMINHRSQHKQHFYMPASEAITFWLQP